MSHSLAQTELSQGQVRVVAAWETFFKCSVRGREDLGVDTVGGNHGCLFDLDILFSQSAELHFQPFLRSEGLCSSVPATRGDLWYVLRVGPTEQERNRKEAWGTFPRNGLKPLSTGCAVTRPWF